MPKTANALLARPALNQQMDIEQIAERLQESYEAIIWERMTREAGLSRSELTARAKQLVETARKWFQRGTPVPKRLGEQLAAFLNLYGQCLVDQGKTERAAEAYREAISLADYNLHYKESYIGCLLALGRVEEAVAEVKSLTLREIESEHSSFAVSVLEWSFANSDFARRISPRRFKEMVLLLNKYPPPGRAFRIAR